MALPRVFPSVVHMLAEAAAAAPAREAVALGAERLTYAEYARCAAGLASELKSLGLSGERVAFVLGNSLDICIAYFGVHAAGCQAVPLNPLYTPRELEQMLGDAAPALVMYEPGVAANVEPVAEKLGIPHRWKVGPGARRLIAWQDRAGLESTLPLPDPESLATLQYTGGTTGRSKGVNVTHRAYAYNISQREALMPSRLDVERILCVMPLFHVYASHCCLHTAAFSRGTMVILPRYHPEEALRALIDEKITIFAGAPTIYTSLLNYEGFARANLSKIYYSV